MDMFMVGFVSFLTGVALAVFLWLYVAETIEKAPSDQEAKEAARLAAINEENRRACNVVNGKAHWDPIQRALAWFDAWEEVLNKRIQRKQ